MLQAKLVGNMCNVRECFTQIPRVYLAMLKPPDYFRWNPLSVAVQFPQTYYALFVSVFVETLIMITLGHFLVKFVFTICCQLCEE